MKLIKEVTLGKYEVETKQRIRLSDEQIDSRIAQLTEELAKWTALKGKIAEAKTPVEVVE